MNSTSELARRLSPCFRSLYDVVGIGLGPANLAIAAHLHENRAKFRFLNSALFLEKQEAFNWHKDMLIEDAVLQVSFLKDLVTLRDPTSSFSFLNYLKVSGRLEEFCNLRTFYPTRTEYNEYLRWVAAQLKQHCSYQSEVIDVEPVYVGGCVESFDIHFRRRFEHRVVRSRSLILGMGRRPSVPDGVIETDRVIHSSRFLSLAQKWKDAGYRRFLVVGGGQSAAEIVNYLYDLVGGSTISAVMPGFAYKMMDDSKFVNQIFDSEMVEYFFSASDSTKRSILKMHNDTNYSAVDVALIDALYRKQYSDMIRGRKRILCKKLSRLHSVGEQADAKLVAVLEDRQAGTSTEETFDAVVLATGYRAVAIEEMAPSLAEIMVRTACGEVALRREYSAITSVPCTARLYIQGSSDHQHGLTSSLLSILALRSQEILSDLDYSLGHLHLRAPVAGTLDA